MWQTDGEKDCVLTRGGLTDVSRSAEVIVPAWQGQPEQRVQAGQTKPWCARRRRDDCRSGFSMVEGT